MPKLFFKGVVLLAVLFLGTNMAVAPAFASQACPTLTRNISRGTTDAGTNGEVSKLQAFLAAHFDVDEEVLVTGFFGNLTRSYVMRFQSEQGLPMLGGVGPLTRARIASVCASQSGTQTTGEVQTVLQGLYNAYSPSVLTHNGTKKMWIGGWVEESDIGADVIYYSEWQNNGTFSEPERSFQFPGYHTNDPSVIVNPHDSQELLMFFTALPNQYATAQDMTKKNWVGVARSRNGGVSWSNPQIIIGQENGIDARGAWSPSALVVGSEIWVYYHTNDGVPNIYRTRLNSRTLERVGTDSTTKDGTPLAGINVDVAWVGNRYVMLLAPTLTEMNRYVSTDGIVWQEDSAVPNPVIRAVQGASVVTATTIAGQSGEEVYFSGGPLVGDANYRYSSVHRVPDVRTGRVLFSPTRAQTETPTPAPTPAPVQPQYPTVVPNTVPNTTSQWTRDRVLLSGFLNMYNGNVVIDTADAQYPYKMWFFGWATHTCNNPSFPQGPSSCDAIFYARSADGAVWQVYAGDNAGSPTFDSTQTPSRWKPVISAQNLYYDQVHNGDPSVVKVGDTYYMVYTASGFDTDGVAEGQPGDTDGSFNGIMGAVSSDGVHWQRATRPFFASDTERGSVDTAAGNMHARPSLMYENGTFKLWFDYWASDQIGLSMGYAEMRIPATKTGFLQGRWNVLRAGNNPLIANWPNPTVVKVGDTYVSFADPIVSSGDTWTGRKITEAVSSDGVTWRITGYIEPDSGCSATHVPEAYVVNRKLNLTYGCQRGGIPYDYTYKDIRQAYREVTVPGPIVTPRVTPTAQGSLDFTACTPGLGKSVVDPTNPSVCDLDIVWNTQGASSAYLVVKGSFPYNPARFPRGYVAGATQSGRAKVWVTTGNYTIELFVNGTPPTNTTAGTGTKLMERVIVIGDTATTSAPTTPSASSNGSVQTSGCRVGVDVSVSAPTNKAVCDASVSWTTTNAQNAYVLISGDFPYDTTHFPHGFVIEPGLSGTQKKFWVTTGRYQASLYINGQYPQNGQPGTGTKVAETTLLIAPPTSTPTPQPSGVTPSGSISAITACIPGVGKSIIDLHNPVICDQTIRWTSQNSSEEVKLIITGDFPYNSTSFPNGFTAGSSQAGAATFWVTTGTYTATLYSGSRKLDEKTFSIVAPAAWTNTSQMAAIIEGFMSLLRRSR